MRAIGFALLLVPCLVAAASKEAIVGNVRVQFLSPTLVRLEEKGPKGFEDRTTFTVVQRKWSGCSFSKQKQGSLTILATANYTVAIPRDGRALAGTVVYADNKPLFTMPDNGVPADGFLPAPASSQILFTVSDTPRIIPPKWGATPPPKAEPNSGWDLSNSAPDVYVFVRTTGNYPALRKEFLKLTGPVPKPPLFTFGFIDSRYHPYTEQEALQSIDTYRQKGIPLDTFVVDTDWRINGSHGYTPEPKYFPDMPRFLAEAKKRAVRIMFNDHPEPQAPGAADPRELQYRYDGLTKLMGEGVDVWWYDRNWGVSLESPMPGLRHEIWGQAVYHDVTQRYRPNQRPLIMANVDGIDNGIRNYAPDPASHRFPIWWTGDTRSTFAYLRRGVENGVDSGVISALPYVNEDLGGHYGGPTAELYTRYLEFGCLSPVTRVHCTRGEDRHPWAFGPEVEGIVTDYIKLRYRLLPTIYTAAQQAYEDGTPLLRRCDLEWPQYKEAADGTQYLFGDDILVAPQITSVAGEPQPIPAGLLKTSAGGAGVDAEYFDNANLEGQAKVSRREKGLSFEWGEGSPASQIPVDKFSARFTAQIGPVPQTGTYRFEGTSDDGMRLFVNGKAVISEWHPSDSGKYSGSVDLEAGKTYELKVEYNEVGGGARLLVGWLPPSERPRTETERTAWIPPGTWVDAWTGETIQGPKTITVSSALWHTPMWLRSGGIIFTTPVVQHTTVPQWKDLGIEAFAPADKIEVLRRLVEDDGISNDYQKGAIQTTKATLRRDGDNVVVRVSRTQGTSPLSTRRLVLRVHLPSGQVPASVMLDGKAVGFTVPTAKARMPLSGEGTGPMQGEGSVAEIVVPALDVKRDQVFTIKTKRA